MASCAERCRLARKPNPNAGWTRDSSWNLQGKWLYKELNYNDDDELVAEWVPATLYLSPTLDRKTGELCFKWSYHSRRGWPLDYPHESCEGRLKPQPLAEAKAWAEAKLEADE